MLLVGWVASVAGGTALAAALPRTRWWVGTISTALLGVFGLALILIDVATYKEPSAALDL